MNICHWLHEILPSWCSGFAMCLFNNGTATDQQLFHSWGDVLSSNVRKTRQPRKIEQRVSHIGPNMFRIYRLRIKCMPRIKAQSSYTMMPSAKVYFTLPCNSMPRNGVFLPWLSSVFASTFQYWPGSKMHKLAAAPIDK